MAFLEFLPITTGTLAGTMMQVRPWQREFLESVDGLAEGVSRPVRTAVLSMPRKQGKTAIAAGLALCHLSGPEAEQRGQVYSAANDRAQAALICNEIAAMISRVSFLDERISLRRLRSGCRHCRHVGRAWPG